MKAAALLLIVAAAALALGDHGRGEQLCGISSLSVTCGSAAR